MAEPLGKQSTNWSATDVGNACASHLARSFFNVITYILVSALLYGRYSLPSVKLLLDNDPIVELHNTQLNLR